MGSVPTGTKAALQPSSSSMTWYWSNDGDVLRLGRWLQAWRKVMAAYRRDDLRKSPAGWLLVHRDQLRAQRLVTSMREVFLLMTMSWCLFVCTAGVSTLIHWVHRYDVFIPTQQLHLTSTDIYSRLLFIVIWIHLNYCLLYVWGPIFKTSYYNASISIKSDFKLL